jgi:hypothetical protein
MRGRTISIQGLLLAGLLAVPVWGRTNPPQPGTVNYVEGQASVGTESLNSNSVGSTELQAGQILTTQKGKVEVLLIPGVFLRVGENSSLRMDSPELVNTAMTLQNGRALLEVADIHKENDIVMNLNNVNVRVTKRGIYDFDGDRGLVRVFNGKAEVELGGREIGVGEGEQLDLRATDKPKARGFNRNEAKDAFYRWSSLRSSYLAEANIDAARSYRAYGSGWYGPGWYWDRWYGAYTWIPGGGILYSPFGWGFYSPGFIYSAPFIGVGFGGYRHFGPAYRPFIPTRRIVGPSVGFRAGFRGGFRGGAIRGRIR